VIDRPEWMLYLFHLLACRLRRLAPAPRPVSRSRRYRIRPGGRGSWPEEAPAFDLQGCRFWAANFRRTPDSSTATGRNQGCCDYLVQYMCTCVR